jgi:hypothetical protein
MEGGAEAIETDEQQKDESTTQRNRRKSQKNHPYFIQRKSMPIFIKGRKSAEYFATPELVSAGKKFPEPCPGASWNVSASVAPQSVKTRKEGAASRKISAEQNLQSLRRYPNNLVPGSLVALKKKAKPSSVRAYFV